MPYYDALVESVEFKETGGSTWLGPYTEIEAGANIEDASDDVNLAHGIAIKRGTRKNISIPVLDAEAFAALKPLMEANKEIDVRITYSNGDQDLLTKILFSVTPLVSQIEDMYHVYIGALNLATVAPGAGWTDLGLILSGSAPEYTAENATDGQGRPYLYKHMSFQQVMELPGASLAALKAKEDTRLKYAVAITHPDGAYRIYNHVRPFARYLPHLGPDNLRTIQLTLRGARRLTADLITFPAAPEDHFYGCLVEGQGFGYNEDDFMTMARLT